MTKKVRSYSLEETELALISSLSDQLNITRSDVVSRAIKAFSDQQSNTSTLLRNLETRLAALELCIKNNAHHQSNPTTPPKEEEEGVDYYYRDAWSDNMNFINANQREVINKQILADPPNYNLLDSVVVELLGRANHGHLPPNYKDKLEQARHDYDPQATVIDREKVYY